MDRFKKLYKDWKSLSAGERALIIHRDFRNNLNGEGYGSFSGEAGVKKYYEFGNQELKEEDLLVFYSDGFVELLKDKSFVELLRDGNKGKLDGFVSDKANQNPEKFVVINFDKK